MSAKLGICRVGWGGALRSAPDRVRGSGVAGSNDDDQDDQVAVLQGQDAKEAVSSLNGAFAAGQLPDLDAPGFPGPVAEAFYWSNDDVLGIQGPVGSGKTTTLMKSRLRRAVEMPRSRVDGVRRYKAIFIRETYRQLWSTTIPSYLEVYPRDLGKWSGGRGDPVTHVVHFEDPHGPIEFTAEFLAFGDSIIQSMRGVQTTDIVLNEADTMPVDILTVGIGRIDRWPGREHFEGLPAHLRSYGQIAADFNAPDEDNWTFKVFHDEEERERVASQLSADLPDGVSRIRISFHRQPGYGETGAENLQHLSPGYYPRQIASMRMAGRGDMIDRLVYNKVVYLRQGDPVWRREFNRRVHVAEDTIPFEPGLPVRIGLDQGFRGAAVIAQPAGFWRWRILAELHFPDDRLMARVFGERLAELLEARCPGARIEAAWGDMAGEHGASQAADENETWNLLVGRAAGFTVRPQVIGTNRIQPRLEAVRAALEAPLEAGEPGLLIDPSCKFLIRGFEARYVWREETDASGDKRKVPDKSFTEANVHDALQYLLLSAHSGDGQSPYARRSPVIDRRPGRPGHNGGPPPDGGTPGGLSTGWNILDPYGGKA